jgi:hypothetical protein
VTAYRRIGVSAWRRGGVAVAACRKKSEVNLDLDLGSIGIRQSRSSIRRLGLTPTRGLRHDAKHVPGDSGPLTTDN